MTPPSEETPDRPGKHRVPTVSDVSWFLRLIRDHQKVADEILYLLYRIRIIPPPPLLTNPGTGGHDWTIYPTR